MTFQSANSNIQVSEEAVIKKESIPAGDIPVFDVNGKLVGSLVPVSNALNAEQTTNKGVANGYPSLDATAKIPVSQLPAAVIGQVSYQGTWNANTNTPALASGVGTKGYYYVVDTPGATNLDGINDWKLGDWAIFNGTSWNKVDNTDAVISVNGYLGAVVLTKSDIGLSNVPNVDTSNAGNISAGTLPDARLSGSVALLTAVQSLTNKSLGAGTKIILGSDATGDLYYRNAGGDLVRLGIGTANQVLTVIGGVPVWQTPASSSSITTRYVLSYTGLISSTIQGLYKASINDTGTAVNPSTSSGNPGFANGAVDPILIPANCTLTRIRIKFAQAATGTAAVGANPTVRMRVYRVDGSTRTSLGDVDIVISPTGVGVFNNLGSTSVQTAQSTLQAIALSAGDLIGLEFVNQSGTNDGINAIGRLFAVITTVE